MVFGAVRRGEIFDLNVEGKGEPQKKFESPQAFSNETQQTLVRVGAAMFVKLSHYLASNEFILKLSDFAPLSFQPLADLRGPARLPPRTFQEPTPLHVAALGLTSTSIAFRPPQHNQPLRASNSWNPSGPCPSGALPFCRDPPLHAGKPGGPGGFSHRLPLP